MDWFLHNAYYFIPLWAFLLDCIVGDPRSDSIRWFSLVMLFLSMKNFSTASVTVTAKSCYTAV